MISLGPIYTHWVHHYLLTVSPFDTHWVHYFLLTRSSRYVSAAANTDSHHRILGVVDDNPGSTVTIDSDCVGTVTDDLAVVTRRQSCGCRG